MKLMIKNSLAVLLLLAFGNLCAADDADMRGAGAPASDGTSLVRRRGAVPADAGEDVAMTEAAATGSTYELSPEQVTIINRILADQAAGNLQCIRYEDGILHIYHPRTLTIELVCVSTVLVAIILLFGAIATVPMARALDDHGSLALPSVMTAFSAITITFLVDQIYFLCQRRNGDVTQFELTATGLTYYQKDWLHCRAPKIQRFSWGEVLKVVHTERIEHYTDSDNGRSTNICTQICHLITTRGSFPLTPSTETHILEDIVTSIRTVRFNNLVTTGPH